MAMDSSAIGINFAYGRSSTKWSTSSSTSWTTSPSPVHQQGRGAHHQDVVWGIATGKFSSGDPYVKESVVLLKQLFDSCATKDWSGITGLSGDGSGSPVRVGQGGDGLRR